VQRLLAHIVAIR